ncbi:hypothetical protein Q5P01_006870 [Channa striata]|uniref:Consortin C-terminal domain-containing protein n=1 Tax=Channa striata TaxID=64152 RepID=A0AA88T156_CHASR|nr:hypothetical protein Q5P01_006870 [Channa striata]
MSQVPAGGVDLCDNLPNPEALTTQTRNLNEKNTLTQTQSLSPSETEEGVRHRLIQNASLNNNGKDEEQAKEGYTQSREKDEEEDTDEVMKGEEEEESEESSALIRCQSPDTPMTDSSFSETGSLLETPYPFSPGTSPEPTSPDITAVSPGTLYSISQVDSLNSPTESVASATKPVPLGHTPLDPTTLTVTSDPMPTSPPRPTCITQTADTHFTGERFTSFTDPALDHRPACTGGSATSYAEPQSSSRPNTTTASTTGSVTFTTGLATTGTDSTSSTGAKRSNWEHITSTAVPSISTCTTGPIPSSALLEFLEQLAQKGDDAHFPQYLHQIAETFVLHEDYQRAIWCIQLERLYHTRVLDNLNSLQEQWENKCRGTSFNLESQHLDPLKHICQTHSRPRARDAVCASLDCLRPTSDERVAQPVCASVHQVDGGMQKKAEDPSFSRISQPVIPVVNLAERLKSPETSGTDKELRDRECFQASPLTDMERSNREVGSTITVIGKGLHPSGAGGMDQSNSAEQQGGDSGPAPEKEVKREEGERDVEEAVDALEMKDEGGEEEDEKRKDGDSALCPEALPAETRVSGTEVEVQQPHQEVPVEEKLHKETQDSAQTSLHQEVHLQKAAVRQEEQSEEEDEEEEEYEVEQADLIREAASLDDMAKLITVEEVSPASGLVSILKKRSVCVDNEVASAGSDSRPDKPTAKRRVRFKVPDDGFEQDVGGGDSCLLLFLLCLVTVVISLGGTALYCALGDVHSSVCQDFSRNVDFYIGQIQRGIAQLQHWFTPGS